MNPTGVYSVLPTPFTPSGEIDPASLKQVIDLYIHAGVHGLTALGVTSEASRLSDVEKLKVLETIMRHVDNRVPVIVGVSADGLQTCIESGLIAKRMHASAVMISPPRMAKLNSPAVIHHYRTFSETVDLPIVVQDYPPASGYTMEASLLAGIAREVPAARTIKLEDPPTPNKIARVKELAGGMPLSILGGLGGTYLLEELSAGASGTMTGFAVPELLVSIVRQFTSGKHDQAADLFFRSVALMRFEFQEGIGLAIRKEILRQRGAMASAFVRPPGAQLDEFTALTMDSMVKWFRNQHKEIAWTLD